MTMHKDRIPLVVRAGVLGLACSTVTLVATVSEIEKYQAIDGHIQFVTSAFATSSTGSGPDAQVDDAIMDTRSYVVFPPHGTSLFFRST